MYQTHRSMCFWRSDVQDAIEALYDRACCYSPSERRAFVTAVCEGSLMDFPASTCAERKASDHCGDATNMVVTR